MIVTVAILRAAGLTEAQILRVVTIADDEQITKTREKNRIAARNYRARHHRHHDADYSDDAGISSFLTDLSSSEDKKVEQQERSELVAQETRDFVTFYQKYPNKVGKPKARAAFTKARRVASLESIMAGLVRYITKTDDRPWCNPATWLNQERWADQPEQVINGKAGQPKTSALDYAASYDARTQMQLKEREEIERQRKQHNPPNA